MIQKKKKKKKRIDQEREKTKFGKFFNLLQVSFPFPQRFFSKVYVRFYLEKKNFKSF